MSRRNKTRPAEGAQPNITTFDAFSNPLFRLGYGSQSPLEATSYPLTRMTGNYALLNSLYRENWVVQNVVGLMVDDMLREWYELKDAAPEQQTALRKAEQRSGLRECLSTGLKWGRLYGGAAGLILIDGQTDLSQPLDLDAIQPGAFRGLYILDRWSGISPDAGLTLARGQPVPISYSIIDAQGHTAARVHHSRILRFTGRELPTLERQAELYWGESEVEALYKDVVAHDNVSANMAALTFQANINTMEYSGLEQLLSLSSPQQQRRFWNVMQAQSVLRSNFGIQLVEKDSKLTNTQYTFTGLQEVYESMCLNLCGASHYPMTKLFGRSPAGMNATGESDLKNYYDYVNTLRESKLRPALEQLLPVLLRSAGIDLPDPEVSFPPLWTPTAKETADIAKTKSDSIVAAFQAGLLDVPAAQKELKKLSDETGMFGSISDEAIAANAGKTYQDVTALRDPLAGLTGGQNIPFELSAADSVPAADYSPSQPRDDHGKWTNGSGTDVTQEYLNHANPGSGTITYGEGYDISRHPEETKIAQWLHENLGGDITLLNESSVEGEKRSDYLWNGTFWDLKTASSEKSANSSIRHGLQQIREKPGGIILDFGSTKFDSEILWQVIDKRMQWNHVDGNVDIMILANGKLFTAKRYNKK